MKAIHAGVLVAAALMGAAAANADEARHQRAPINQSDLARLAAPYAGLYRTLERFETVSFASADEVTNGLQAVGRVSPDDLSIAWTAYAALSASVTPEYMDGVRGAVDLYGAERVAKGLRRDPRYARSLAGGDDAVRIIVTRLTDDADALRAAAARVDGQSYAVQDQPWALTRHGAAQTRLAVLTAAAADIRPADPQLTAWLAERASDTVERESEERFRPFRIASAFAGSGGRPAAAPHRTYDGAIDGALTLAALTMLDEARGEDASLYSARQVKQCSAMARLNIEQCIAASAFPYEDVFCIAEHGINEVAGCVDPSR